VLGELSYLRSRQILLGTRLILVVPWSRGCVRVYLDLYLYARAVGLVNFQASEQSYVALLSRLSKTLLYEVKKLTAIVPVKLHVKHVIQ